MLRLPNPDLLLPQFFSYSSLFLIIFPPEITGNALFLLETEDIQNKHCIVNKPMARRKRDVG